MTTPYQVQEYINEKEKENAPILEAFENGWDSGVEAFEKGLGKNFWTELYWFAYSYCKNGDPDSGFCFTLRERAVGNLTKILMGEEV